MKKLAVCYPWASPFMFTGFTDSTLNMKHPEGWEVKYFRGTGWCPARRHIDFCEQALNWGADLICIIGADQVHPPDMLCRLIDRWDQGYQIVAALVPVRCYVNWMDMKPFQPMAWRFKTNDETGSTKLRPYRGMTYDRDMVHVITREDGDIVRADFIGTGVLMFHRDHLLALEKPWFRERVIDENYVRLATMDTTFVWRLQHEGCATLWVDTTIMVEHLHIFSIDDSYSERFSDWARPNVGDSDICKFEEPKPSK